MISVQHQHLRDHLANIVDNGYGQRFELSFPSTQHSRGAVPMPSIAFMAMSRTWVNWFSKRVNPPVRKLLFSSVKR
ncbi:hypothetical protein KIF59_21090 [Enterobacter cloacae subsp. cloacae]|nr:hypothetical protein [Enterobacter cloacae subsp. cloacae]